MLPTIEYLRECFDYDPETGVLKWRERPRSHFRTERGWRCANSQRAGTLAGSPTSYGYLSVRVDGRPYLVHRIIFAIANNLDMADVPSEVDHEDTDRSNNRADNLRPATHAENAQNTGLRANNTSGVKGVTWSKQHNKWHVRIYVNKKCFQLGYFHSLDDATTARESAQHLHGEFARMTNDNNKLKAAA